MCPASADGSGVRRAERISLPTLGHLDDSIDAGRHVIPAVRQLVAERGIDLDRAHEVVAPVS